MKQSPFHFWQLSYTVVLTSCFSKSCLASNTKIQDVGFLNQTFFLFLFFNPIWKKIVLKSCNFSKKNIFLGKDFLTHILTFKAWHLVTRRWRWPDEGPPPNMNLIREVCKLENLHFHSLSFSVWGTSLGPKLIPKAVLK